MLKRWSMRSDPSLKPARSEGGGLSARLCDGSGKFACGEGWVRAEGFAVAVVLLIIWRTVVLIMWHTHACGRALRHPARIA